MFVTWQIVPLWKVQLHVTFLTMALPIIVLFPNPPSPLQERDVTFQFNFSILEDIVSRNFTAKRNNKKKQIVQVNFNFIYYIAS